MSGLTVIVTNGITVKSAGMLAQGMLVTMVTIMVNHSTYTTYEKILFNTKSLRQLRLCDLECIGGKDRDRIMYLDFCPTELPCDESSPLKLKLAMQPPLKRLRSKPYIPPPTPP